jgi:hypothetical protein
MSRLADGSAPRGTTAGALSLAGCDSPSKRLAGGHPLQRWAACRRGGRLRAEDRRVGVSHRDSRRNDLAGVDGAVCWNALRITGEFRRWTFHRAGSTAEQPPQTREKSRAALLGCARPFLRRGTNGTRNSVRSGFHDRQRIGGRGAGDRHEQHKRIHVCFFLETKASLRQKQRLRGAPAAERLLS